MAQFGSQAQMSLPSNICQHHVRVFVVAQVFFSDGLFFKGKYPKEDDIL